MLSTGEPRHFTAWEFPSLPKLRPIDNPAGYYPGETREMPQQWHQRGLTRLLRDVLRGR
jgi:hypothetical protein